MKDGPSLDQTNQEFQVHEHLRATKHQQNDLINVLHRPVEVAGAKQTQTTC